MSNKTHSKEQAESLVYFLRETVSEQSILIGSLGKGADVSYHDIDIYIPNKKKSNRLKKRLFELLGAQKVEDTDWGGYYFSGTRFGNVDIFFSIEDFDY